MTNIKDIARIAGVSVGTVSNVINKKNNVNQQMRDKVLHAIDESNYKVNLLAKGMACNRSYNIGIVVPSVLTRFFPKIANVVEGIAFKNGYNVILASSNDDEKKERDVCENLLLKNCDGLLIIPLGDENIPFYNDLFLNRDIPIVLILRHFKNSKIPYVIANNIQTTNTAMTYLIEEGHKDILYVTNRLCISSHMERYKAYLNLLKKVKIKERIEIYPDDIDGFKIGYDLIQNAYKNNNLPTAIFADEDYIAIGCMKACYELGLKIPDVISIIGVGNVFPNEMLYKNLTTIDPHPELIAKKAVEVLCDRIELKVNKEEKKYNRLKHVIDTTLIIGDTV